MADGRIKANKNTKNKKVKQATKERKGNPPGPMSRYISLQIGSKLDVIRGWIANGATHSEIAQTFDVSSAIISQWKTQHPEFKQAMESNKPQAVGKVISAAFDQAVGYERPEKVIFKLRREWFEEVANKAVRFTQEELEERIVMKYYPPNPKMTEFLLVNWDPEHFKRISDVEPESGKKLEDFFDSVDKDVNYDAATTSTEEKRPVEPITQ